MSKCISRERKKSRRVAAETEEAVGPPRPVWRGSWDSSSSPGGPGPTSTFGSLKGAGAPGAPALSGRGTQSGRRRRHEIGRMWTAPRAQPGSPARGAGWPPARRTPGQARRPPIKALWSLAVAAESPTGPPISLRAPSAPAGKARVSSTPQSPRSPHWGAAALNNALGRRCPAQRQLCVEQVQRPPRFLSSKAPATGRKGPHLRLHPLGAVSP